jgi:hypothetical protein
MAGVAAPGADRVRDETWVSIICCGEAAPVTEIGVYFITGQALRRVHEEHVVE